MNNSLELRLIDNADTQAVLDIYRYYVENTAISFEYEAPSLEEHQQRINTNTINYPWLVCLYNNKIIGFAYGSTHRYRTAYQWSPEATIYLAPDFHTKGFGRILYETLFSLMKLQGYYNVFAGVALPNEKSLCFHQALGFKEIGTFKNVGFKHGHWHDTHWFQLILHATSEKPLNPKLLKEAAEEDQFKHIIADANQLLNSKFKV